MARGRKAKVEAFVPKADDVPVEERARREGERLRPRGFTKAQARLWNERVLRFYMRGILREDYADILFEYIVCLDDIRRYRAVLKAEGETYISEGRQGTQIKNRPEIGQLNERWRNWARLVAELRMTPASARELGDIEDLFDRLNTRGAEHLDR